jgi:hypothetical protein
MIEMGKAYKILVEKLEGEALVGRPTCKWEDRIIKFVLQKQDVRACTEFIWFRIGISGRLLSK